MAELSYKHMFSFVRHHQTVFQRGDTTAFPFACCPVSEAYPLPLQGLSSLFPRSFASHEVSMGPVQHDLAAPNTIQPWFQHP